MSRRAELSLERRKAAGLPTLTCPECGMPEPHWSPDWLDDHELVHPGFFTCRPVVVADDDGEGLF